MLNSVEQIDYQINRLPRRMRTHSVQLHLRQKSISVFQKKVIILDLIDYL